jgi:hypothetical protein
MQTSINEAQLVFDTLMNVFLMLVDKQELLLRDRLNENWTEEHQKVCQFFLVDLSFGVPNQNIYQALKEKMMTTGIRINDMLIFTSATQKPLSERKRDLILDFLKPSENENVFYVYLTLKLSLKGFPQRVRAFTRIIIQAEKNINTE